MAKRKKSIKVYQEFDDNIFTSLVNIQPITNTQKKALQYFNEGSNLVLHGIAGTGKTFLACYFALTELIRYNSKINNIIIIRSVVPTRQVGHLPGNLEEKVSVYETPYESIFYELLKKFESYQNLKERNMLNFSTTSFIRGITFDNCFVIVDECQNMNLHELDSIITRLGKNCKIIFSGDFMQTDFRNINERNGILDFMTILNSMESFEIVEFSLQDIVRSSLVKEYIEAKTKLAFCVA